MTSVKDYDGMATTVFVVGLFEGFVPFPAKLLGWEPILALPTRLPSPWWWIVSGLVLATSVALLERIDQARRRAA